MARTLAPVAPDIEPAAAPPEDYQHLQTNPRQFGGQIGAAVEAAAAPVKQLGQFYGQVAADDAANQWQDQVNKILYGDPQKQVIGPDGQPVTDTGYFGLKGRAALDARPQVEGQLDTLLKEARGNLLTLDQQLDFDRNTRRYRSYLGGQIGRHADSQFATWSTQVNSASAKLALDHIAQNAQSDDEFANGTADLMRARVRQAQIAGGGDALINQALDSSRRDAAEARIKALLPTDPEAAGHILEQNRDILAGAGNYDALSHAVGAAQGNAVADRVFAGQYAAGGGATAAPDHVGNWEVQHNNFGGIRKPGIIAGPKAGGFQSYATPEQGVGAIRDLLAAYQDKHGLDTIRGIVSRWAPPSENDTAALIDRAVRVTGFGPDQKLDLHDSPTMAKMIEATIRNEQGGKLPVAADIITKVAGSPGATAAPEQAAPATQETAEDRSLAAMYAAIDRERLPPAVAEHAKARVRQQYDAVAADWSRQQRIDKQQRESVRDARSDQIYADAYSDKPTITARQIAVDPAFDGFPERRKQMIDLINNPPGSALPAAQSWNAALSLLDRIRRPDGDPDKITDMGPIYDAAVHHQLNKGEFDFVKKELADQRTPGGEIFARRKADFLKNVVAPQLDRTPFVRSALGNLAVVDMKGRGELYKFEWALDRKIDEYRAAHRDPGDLLDPAKPDYMGTAEALKGYQPTLAQVMQDVNAQLGNAPAAAGKTEAGKAGAVEFTTKDGIVAAYKAGLIDRQKALDALVAHGFARPSAPALPGFGQVLLQ